MLLNTSFNENEPIVMTPEHAVDTFLTTQMDLLVLGNYVVRRNDRLVELDESRRRPPCERRRPLPPRGAEPGAARSASSSSRSIAARSAGDVARRDEHARHVVLDGVGEPADRGRDDRPSPRHRLARGDAVALAPRRRGDDRGALVVRRRAPPGARSPTRSGHPRAQRPVADDDERQAAARLDELEHALLLREPPDVEHVRRLVRRADRVGDGDAARDDPDVARAERRAPASARNDDAAITSSRAAGAPAARATGSAPGELEVRAPHLHDERRAERRRDRAGREPVRVDEIRVARRPRRRMFQRNAGTSSAQPRPRAQVADDPVAVRDAEVPERRRRDDLDLDAARAHVLDRVGDEASRRRPRARAGTTS